MLKVIRLRVEVTDTGRLSVKVVRQGRTFTGQGQRIGRHDLPVGAAKPARLVARAQQDRLPDVRHGQPQHDRLT